MNSIAQNLPPTTALDQPIAELIIASAASLSKNSDFNSEKSFTVVQNLLENTFNILDTNTIMSPKEAESVSDILNSMMQFTAYYDCQIQAAFTQDLAVKTPEYLDAIIRALLDTKIPNETPNIINEANYDIYAQKVALCDLDKFPIVINQQTPQISFDPAKLAMFDCKTIVNV